LQGLAGELVADRVVVTKDGLNADDAARVVLGVSQPGNVQLKVRDHDEPVGANQPMQLLQVRVKLGWWGQGLAVFHS